MRHEQGYNGWKNYESWSVALVIDNDEYLQSRAYGIVQARIAAGNPSEHWKDGDWQRFVAADALKDWIETEAEVLTANLTDLRPVSYLWSQLVSAALSDVDWEEIANHYLEGVEA